MFEGAECRAVVQALGEVAVEQAVDDAGREGVAGAQTVDDFDFVGHRLVERPGGVADGAEAVAPDQRRLAHDPRDVLHAEAPVELFRHLREVRSHDPEELFGVGGAGDQQIDVRQQFAQRPTGLGDPPEFAAVILNG